jgi:hypothetical protein
MFLPFWFLLFSKFLESFIHIFRQSFRKQQLYFALARMPSVGMLASVKLVKMYSFKKAGQNL